MSEPKHERFKRRLAAAQAERALDRVADLTACPDCGENRHPSACLLAARVLELEDALKSVRDAADYNGDEDSSEMAARLSSAYRIARSALARQGTPGSGPAARK